MMAGINDFSMDQNMVCVGYEVDWLNAKEI